MNSRITLLAAVAMFAFGAAGAAMAQSTDPYATPQATPQATAPQPPEPVTPPKQVVPASALQPTTITSSEPDSTLANKVDFDALDGNHDGMLSRREVSANAELTQDFAAIDTNHDGQITRKELAGGK